MAGETVDDFKHSLKLQRGHASIQRWMRFCSQLYNKREGLTVNHDTLTRVFKSFRVKPTSAAPQTVKRKRLPFTAVSDADTRAKSVVTTSTLDFMYAYSC